MLPAALLWALMLGAPDVDLQTRIDRAEVAVGEGRWLDAADEYEVVFEATGDLRVRYAQAEALRLGGACEQALPAYEDYLGGKPSEAMQARTEQLIRVCREEVARKTALEAPPLIPEPEPETTPPDTVAPPSQSPWYRDPAGDALVGVGLAGSIVGGVVLGLGLRKGKTSDQASSDRAFAASLDQARTMTLAGGITLGASGALLLGGVVRWVVVGRHSPNVDVAVSGNGFSVRGRLPTLVQLSKRKR